MNHRVYTLIPVLLFLASLFLPALNVSGRSEFGYSILATGWFQSYISIAAIENWASHGMLTSKNFWPSLLMMFPWLANVFLVFSVVFQGASKLRPAAISAVLALACAIVFFVYPVAMLGPDGISVQVTPMAGAYLWGLSSIAAVLLAVVQYRRAKSGA